MIAPIQPLPEIFDEFPDVDVRGLVDGGDDGLSASVRYVRVPLVEIVFWKILLEGRPNLLLELWKLSLQTRVHKAGCYDRTLSHLRPSVSGSIVQVFTYSG